MLRKVGREERRREETLKCRAAPQIRLRRLRRGLYTPRSTEDLANLEIVRLATC
jgi:hypothetical protein